MRTRLSSSAASILLASLVACLGGAGCGSDDDDGDQGPAQAGAAGTVSTDDDDGGSDGQSTGGKKADAGDGNDATGGKTVSEAAGAGGALGSGAAGASSHQGGDGSAEPTAQAGQGGSGATPSTPSDAGVGGEGSTSPEGDLILDDLIEAICGWEFKCCDDGERKYRLSKFADTAAACKGRFVYELRESNDTQNPYVAGSALGLLGTLGYVVDLSRVTVNAAGVRACIEQWEAAECMTDDALIPLASCPGPVDATDSPCALQNLFSPTLGLGDECTLAFGQDAVGVNDIECPPGSSCLAASAPGNNSDLPACVNRGEQGDPCTTDTVCDYDFYCSDEGRCTAKGDVGDGCSYEDPDVPLPGEEAEPCKAGLTCNPSSKVCVDDCTVGTVCAADSQCPEGTSCAPLTIGDDSTSFHACRDLGHASSARCDDEKDCEAGWYCTVGGVCSEDVSLSDGCTVDAQCPEGTFCDDVDLVCAAYSGPGDVCVRDTTTFASEQCGPTRNCIYNADNAQPECSTSKLALGIECAADFDCQSGLCERADEADPPTCVAGAGDGDDCDDNVNTADAQRCAPGLACIEANCVTLQGPGADCEAAAGGVADPVVCANRSCVEQWESFMCTDAMVPKTSGGTGLVCDGGD